jgi:hypothetical protein
MEMLKIANTNIKNTSVVFFRERFVLFFFTLYDIKNVKKKEGFVCLL